MNAGLLEAAPSPQCRSAFPNLQPGQAAAPPAANLCSLRRVAWAAPRPEAHGRGRRPVRALLVRRTARGAWLHGMRDAPHTPCWAAGHGNLNCAWDRPHSPIRVLATAWAQSALAAWGTLLRARTWETCQRRARMQRRCSVVASTYVHVNTNPLLHRCYNTTTWHCAPVCPTTTLRCCSSFLRRIMRH